MSIFMDEKLTSVESMLEDWDFFSKPYHDEDVLKSFGTTVIDGEDVQITNHMMKSIVELLEVVRTREMEWRNTNNRLVNDVRDEVRKRDHARKHAAMSDARIGDALDEEIKWFEANAGEESLVYGPTELMGYCRDRLRNRQ